MRGMSDCPVPRSLCVTGFGRFGTLLPWLVLWNRNKSIEIGGAMPVTPKCECALPLCVSTNNASTASEYETFWLENKPCGKADFEASTNGQLCSCLAWTCSLHCQRLRVEKWSLTSIRWATCKMALIIKFLCKFCERVDCLHWNRVLQHVNLSGVRHHAINNFHMRCRRQMAVSDAAWEMILAHGVRLCLAYSCPDSGYQFDHAPCLACCLLDFLLIFNTREHLYTSIKI